MARYNRIFAALDGGDTQEAVARRALSIAHDNSADVLFGHVIDVSDLATSGLGNEALAENAKQTIEHALSRFLKRAAGDPCVPSVEVQVRCGRIAETIMDAFVEPFKPDLIICGARGLSNIKYAFVGSVSTHLVRHAQCDVLTVHAETIEPVNEYDYEHLVDTAQD